MSLDSPKKIKNSNENLVTQRILENLPNTKEINILRDILSQAIMNSDPNTIIPPVIRRFILLSYAKGNDKINISEFLDIVKSKSPEDQQSLRKSTIYFFEKIQKEGKKYYRTNNLNSKYIAQLLSKISIDNIYAISNASYDISGVQIVAKNLNKSLLEKEFNKNVISSFSNTIFKIAQNKEEGYLILYNNNSDNIEIPIPLFFSQTLEGPVHHLSETEIINIITYLINRGFNLGDNFNFQNIQGVGFFTEEDLERKNILTNEINAFRNEYEEVFETTIDNELIADIDTKDRLHAVLLSTFGQLSLLLNNQEVFITVKNAFSELEFNQDTQSINLIFVDVPKEIQEIITKARSQDIFTGDIYQRSGLQVSLKFVSHQELDKENDDIMHKEIARLLAQ